MNNISKRAINLPFFSHSRHVFDHFFPIFRCFDNNVIEIVWILSKHYTASFFYFWSTSLDTSETDSFLESGTEIEL